MKKRITKTLALVLLAASLLFIAEAKGEEVLRKLKVVTEQANIRLKPSIGSIIIKQVPQGTILESTSQEGDWYSIKLAPGELQQVSGYVHESMVIVIEGPPREQEEPEIITEEEEIKKPEEEEKVKETPLPKPVITPPSQPVVTPPPPSRPAKFPFGLVFSGGGSFISGGDLNDGSQGLADYRSHVLATQPKGQAKPAHLSYLFGGELNLALSPQLSLGIGADYFLGERESLIEFPEDPSSETITVHPKMQAVPLRLALSFSPAHNFYAKIGLEYYFAKSFNFVVEATVRYARISGFKGKNRSRDSTGTNHLEEGTLYFYRVQTAGEESYPFLFILEDRPTQANIFDPREAVINFSGLSLKTGFKVKF
jgi:hypothetical protein